MKLITINDVYYTHFPYKDRQFVQQQLLSEYGDSVILSWYHEDCKGNCFAVITFLESY